MSASKRTAVEHPAIWRRIVATGIDFILVPAISFVLMIVTGLMETADAYAGYQPWFRGVILGTTAYLLLNGWLLCRRGQTIGKWMTRIRVVTLNGDVPDWWNLILVRALFFPLLYLPVLYPMVGIFAVVPFIDLAFAISAQRRSLHDLVAGTRVAAV
ncbi:MAG: RDD family protein [Pseudomonadota bacterium]